MLTRRTFLQTAGVGAAAARMLGATPAVEAASAAAQAQTTVCRSKALIEIGDSDLVDQPMLEPVGFRANNFETFTTAEVGRTDAYLGNSEDLDVARWLIEHGADVNARAAVDRTGFGGQTPIFNCVVTYNAGRRDEVLGRLLLDCGADPNARASIRKRLAFAADGR